MATSVFPKKYNYPIPFSKCIVGTRKTHIHITQYFVISYFKNLICNVTHRSVLIKWCLSEW